MQEGGERPAGRPTDHGRDKERRQTKIEKGNAGEKRKHFVPMSLRRGRRRLLLRCSKNSGESPISSTFAVTSCSFEATFVTPACLKADRQTTILI